MKIQKIVFYFFVTIYSILFLIQFVQSYFIIDVQMKEIKSGVNACMSYQYRSDHPLSCSMFIEKDKNPFFTQVLSHTFKNFRWCIIYDQCNEGLAFNTFSYLSVANTLFNLSKLLL
jgi:hypothetical protein